LHLTGKIYSAVNAKGRYQMHNFRFSVVIEKDDDGYTAFCPELQGCYAQGESYEEVLANIRDAIRLHLDDRIESGEKIPQAQLINLTTVDVSV
jgi:predicted RNase H-like HicB family nuclease